MTKPISTEHPREICPKWSKIILDKKPYDPDSELDLEIPAYCVVGEAHGWNPRYKLHCSACKEFAVEMYEKGMDHHWVNRLYDKSYDDLENCENWDVEADRREMRKARHGAIRTEKFGEAFFRFIRHFVHNHYEK